jgi:flagellar biosynthesis protein FlhB
MDDKPFEPTPTRLARARREGELPRSPDASAVSAFAGAALGFGAAVGPCASATHAALADAAHGTVAAGPYAAIAVCAGLPALGAVAGAIAAHLLVAGGVTLRAPALDIRRLNPFAGFKTMLSREAALNAAKALVAGTAIAVAAWPAVAATFGGAARGGSPGLLAALVTAAFVRIVLAGLTVAATFAALDVAAGRAKWRRNLRMTFDELKRDLKQEEGDPQFRGRRRKAHGALVRGSLGRIREAAFVVANPQHVAVALAYRPPEIAVPLVLIRALDEGAQLVKERARALEIPIVEDVTLARSLFAQCRVDGFIPRDAYDAVARIVAALVHQHRLAVPRSRP